MDARKDGWAGRRELTARTEEGYEAGWENEWMVWAPGQLGTKEKNAKVLFGRTEGRRME